MVGTAGLGVSVTRRVFAAGFFLSRIENGVRHWLLLKNSKRGDWGFPKGHCNKGERLIDCAIRECAEETGIALLEITSESFALSYHVNGDRVKEVHYFSAETEQEKVSLSKEHTEAVWVPEDRVIELVGHPTTQAVFKKYVATEKQTVAK